MIAHSTFFSGATDKWKRQRNKEAILSCYLDKPVCWKYVGGGFIQSWAMKKFLEGKVPAFGRKILASVRSKVYALFVFWWEFEFAEILGVSVERRWRWSVFSKSQHTSGKLTCMLCFWDLMLRVPLEPCLFIFYFCISLSWLTLPYSAPASCTPFSCSPGVDWVPAVFSMVDDGFPLT